MSGLIRKMKYPYISPAEREANTDKFITKYCQHYSIANPRPPMRNLDVIEMHWQRLLKDYEGVDKDAVKRYMNKRKYGTVFLTSYWWYIIRHKRLAMDGFACAGMNCMTPDDKELHVHHIDLDYGIRGEEPLHMDGLVTLCKYCHNIAHGKKAKTKRKLRRNIIVLESSEEKGAKGVANLIALAKTMGASDQEICNEVINILDDAIDFIASRIY